VPGRAAVTARVRGSVALGRRPPGTAGDLPAPPRFDVAATRSGFAPERHGGPVRRRRRPRGG
jgi:hypothetical protein